jgi:hypothetical protein
VAGRIYGLVITAVTASGMLTQSIGQATADPLLSRSGLYEVISRLELPHLERWAIDKKTWVCLFSREESHAIPLPVLSGNNPFATCSASNFTTHAGTFQYDILCPGRGAAKAHAIYELGPDKFAGRIAMVMGAKNMTMTEIQHAKRVGDCKPEGPQSFGSDIDVRVGAEVLNGSKGRHTVGIRRLQTR